MRKIFNIFLAVSFLFLFIYLVRQELIIPVILHPWSLVLSFLCLFAGFYASTVSWRVALVTHGFSFSSREALVSHGLSVFAKYIPGKIWVILGRAGYLSTGRDELKRLSFVSLREQLVYLWAGLVVSTIPTLIFYGFRWISILVLLTAGALTLLLFFQRVHTRILQLLRRIIRREMELPLIRFRGSLPMIGAVLLIWICWTAGFYLFMDAFITGITPVMVFAFPLSVSFGLIAFILPGGVGVREGIIIGYLTLAGLEVEAATTISFMNRLWFICGELFIFLTAVLCRIATSGAPRGSGE